jgi:tol-pal system protein YbgF
MRYALLLLTLPVAGCFAFMTKQEGKELKDQIDLVQNLAAKNEVRAGDLAKQMDEQLKRLRVVVDEATKVVTRNSADVGLTVQKLQQDLGQFSGRIDDLQHAEDALTKQFQDYRAASDTKLESLTNTMTSAKTPPMPETADGVFSEGEKRLQAQQFADARRLFEGFVNRYPTDGRAAKAQFDIGEAYMGEKRYANAIGAYTKVVDNFPKADVVPDAMFKNGEAFYALKYCSDAKVYFQELLKRYPKTNWKKDANDELKKLQRDQKNKAACSS